ncbi:hypothetical protein ABIE62_002944 [Porphyrobacter sp. MBR-155]|jgi:hypothetical protein
MRLLTAPSFECASLHRAMKTPSRQCSACVVNGANYSANLRTDILRLICRKLE